MGLYFRKRIKILPGLTVNVGKKGASLSVGAKGAKVNIGKRGAYLTTGIPGTGIYARTKIGGAKKSKETRTITNVGTPSEDEAKAIEIIKSNGMLAAVKWYKDSHGCGLAEAKAYIDSIMGKHGLSPQAGNAASGGQGCMVAILVAIVSTIFALLLI